MQARFPMDDSNAVTGELLALNQRLLDAIMAADWTTYEQLCDPSLSAFEPEARGHMVQGLPFHRFYFATSATGERPPQATMCSPHVRLLGADVAVVSYVRLVQKLDATGAAVSTATEETRVWQRQSGTWRHVHFHRSRNA